MNREQQFITSMAAVRKRRRVTQVGLARQLKVRGFGFHQETVRRVEDGRRPVRLNEAFAIADILSTSLQDMCESLEVEIYGMPW